MKKLQKKVIFVLFIFLFCFIDRAYAYDYSKYNPSTVYTAISASNSIASLEENSIIIDACTNPDILRVIYFAKLILDIVKIVIPVGLIIMGMIDFSKSVVTSDEGTQKKNVKLFVKRIIFAVLVFAVPWIVETLIVSLGNLTDGVNFTDCLKNANPEKIEELDASTPLEEPKPEEDKNVNEYSCYYCPSSNSYLWRPGTPSENCPGGVRWIKQTGKNIENCK